MSQKKNISLSSSKMGMNKDSHFSNLKPEEYTHALNSNFWSENGDTFNIQNEPSNLLASRLKEGFFVIGLKNDVYSNSTYFFLVNPQTGVSEIGQIKNINTLPDLSDDIIECSDCEYKTVLSEPLEGQTQTETQQYTTLLNDECNNCLNFSKEFPIKSVEIKNEKCGRVMYFTDNLNPPRYIELDNLDKYSFEGEELCGDDSDVIDVCVACEKMLIFRRPKIPNLLPSEIVLGGNLKRGTYEFLITYSDELGNEIGRYYSITNPIPIFDENNNVLNQENLADETNFAIKLKVDNLDLTYTHYKIAVIQRTDINSATSYFVEGVHSTSDNEIIYTTDQDKERTTLSQLNIQSQRVEKWKSLTTANNHIFGSGITYTKRMNLQPIVNLMGIFVNWQTNIAKEGLYKNGIASSEYRGYYRDETYPLGIRFLLDGEYSPTYHFIGRPPTPTDIEEVVGNKDRESVDKFNESCIENTITKRWQIYNTARELGSCSLDEEILTNIITETVEKLCFIPNVDELNNGEISLTLVEGQSFIDLETYIDENRDFLIQIDNSGNCSSNYPQGLCDLAALINPANHPENCEPDFSPLCSEVGVGDPCCTVNETPISESIEVSSITEEQITRVPFVFPDDYNTLPPPDVCSIHEIDASSGGKLRDTEFEDNYFFVANPSIPQQNLYRVYERNYNSTNETCNYAEEIIEYNSFTQYVPSYFHNYYGGDTITELQLPTLSGSDCPITSEFTSNIHKGALWFKKDTTVDKEFIIDITPQNIPYESNLEIGQNEAIRINIFDSCTSISIFCDIIDPDDGISYKFKVDGTDLYINETGAETLIGTITNNDFYIVIDCPMEESTDSEENTTYVVRPTNGCFGVISKPIQYSRVDITFDSIVVDKSQTYQATCSFEVPVLIDSCSSYPHKYGEFGYVESTEEYPDNEQLYNSSILNISTDDIPDEAYFTGKTFKEYFEDNYVQTTEQGTYVLNENTDFRCESIRHFRFPDNNVSPFMYENEMVGFGESIIYPLGITINEEIINSFLDIAVKNNLITQKQRDSIQGYEIVRGDRTANESIVAKGLTFDMMKYQEDNKEILYSNYPFNDLGDDKLNYEDTSRTSLVPHPYNSTENKAWTFDSPDTNKDNITLPSFMKVEGFMYGKSRGRFDEVREHPKWVILGRKLNNLASTLATLEVIAEGIINIASSSNVYRVQFGFSNSANPVGIGMNIAVAVISTISGVVFNYAKYKYEWLRIFKDLGAPENFAYYYTAEGYYNYFKPNINREGEVFRYLNIAKNIKDGRLIITDPIGGEKLTVNHTDRERTVLLSSGEDTKITYPTEFINYDNGNVDFNSSSRTFASESNACKKGMSKELEKNVASMYVSLKNYLPSQYGTIGSVRWLTTGYRGDLNNPRTDCLSIFGGDVFITRNATLRRFPLFLTTAMNQATLTAFDYKTYSNIGQEPRFYCNYELNTEDRQGSNVLPDIDSDYKFDCLSGISGNYIKEPSKFYLYYNGIPNYLVESTINVWNRYAQPEPWNNFYPNVGDYMEWTQEVVNPIRRQIPFFYNNTYSKNVTQTATLTLPSNYDKEEYDCKTDSPNGTMYSLPDNSENSYIDPWLIYRPLDKYEFPANYGDLVELRGIETAQVLGRFKNQTVIFNAVDTLTDDGQSPDAQILGTGGIFARRPRTFAETDLGYAGTQTQQMVSCEYGHFFVDADRGQVFKVNNGGQGLEEISAYSNNQGSGMRQWFKKQLPFKIKKYFPEVDIDNPYTGVGISMGWDSMFRRVFITKKDYIPINECLEYEDGKFLDCNISCPEGYEYNEKTGLCDSTEECDNEGLDVVFIIDRTTSQLQAIDSIKNNLTNQIVPTIASKFGTNYRYGLVTVSDTRQAGIPIFENILPMSLTNSTSFVTEVNNITLGGNFNLRIPEPTDMALEAVLNNTGEIDLNGDAILGSNTIGTFRATASKAIILITDAAPSGINDDYEYTDLLHSLDLADQSNTQGIQIFSILTSETEPPYNVPPIGSLDFTNDVRYVMEEYASRTNGQYYFKSLGVDINDDIVDALTNQITCAPPIDPIKEEVYVSNKDYFKEVSWTIAYSVDTGKWISYYSFLPNYYVSHNEYFQSGINVEGSEKGLWSHLLTNKSFSVFYGKAYPWEIEIPSTNQGNSKYMENFTYGLDVRRYRDQYDYFQNKKIGFDQAIIFNQSNCSGKLKLDLQTTVKQLPQYPKTNGDTQSILQTSQDGEFRFNYFYNRVKNNDNMLTIFETDENQIHKALNQQALSFTSRRVLERLRGNVFLINLQSFETQHKKIFEIAKTKETIYDK